MGKRISAVIVGYVAMFVIVFLLFSLAWVLMKTDGAFEPGSFEVSGAWIACSIAIGLIAAIVGGALCKLIAKDSVAVKWLAGFTLSLGLILAVPVLLTEDEVGQQVRRGEVTMSEAMQTAKQPVWLAFLNPVLGAVGIMLGGGLKKLK